MANVNTNLLDAAVSHQIYLERYSSQVAKDMLSILIKSERSAREIFDQRISRILELGFDSGPATSNRTAALISDLGAAIEKLRQQEAFDHFATALNAELEDFADYEAGFIVRTNNDILSDALDGTPFAISFESVAPAQVFAAATAKPFNISPGTMAKTLGDYISGMASSERRRIEDAVTTGVVNGQTTRDIVRSVWGTIENRKEQNGNAAVIKTRRGAEAIVRTAIKHVSTVAQDETYKANSDLIKSLIWTSTLDGRTSSICISRDNQEYPVDSGPRPPAHFNAICTGEMVTTATGKKPIEQVAVGDMVLTHKGRFKPVTAVMRKPCDTNVVRVITMETGSVIKVTDEHPVLLHGSGWIRADELKIGDQLFENVCQNKPVSSRLPVVVGAPNNYPSIFDGDEVFFEVGVISGQMASTINLNNDSFGHKYKVSNGSTHDDLSFVPANSNSVKEINKILLTLGRVCKLIFSNGVQDGFKKFVSFGRIVFGHSFRMPSKMSAIRFVQPMSPMCLTNSDTPINSVLSTNCSNFGTAQCVDSVLFSPSTHSAISKPELSLNSSKAFVSDDIVFSDEVFTEGFVSKFNHWVCSSVSDISIVAYDDYVYNLEVKDDNTYLVNDIVVHNCRSVMTPKLKTYRELGINVDEPAESTRAYLAIPAKMNVTQYRAQLRREGLTKAQQDKVIRNLSGQTDDPDFASFLNRQSKQFQETVLGKQRTALYRKGDLSLKDLISPQGQYYTLQQLREMHPSAFDKAGIE